MKSVGRIGIYGASGSGKSTKAKELLKARDRVVIFDPMAEYGGRGGAVSVHTMPQLVKELKNRWRTGFRLAFVPPAQGELAALHELSLLLKRIQSGYATGASKTEITLLVEELNLGYPNMMLPPDRNGFGELCSRGRHYGIEIIGITQRPAEVSTRWRGNTSESYWFRQADYRDLQTAGAMLGPQAKVTLKALPTHHYLHFALGVITPGKNGIYLRR